MYHGYVPGMNCCYFYCCRTVKSNFWIRSTKSTNRVESLDCLSRDRSGINQPQISLVSMLREAFQIRVEGTSRILASGSIMMHPLNIYCKFSIMWIEANIIILWQQCLNKGPQLGCIFISTCELSLPATQVSSLLRHMLSLETLHKNEAFYCPTNSVCSGQFPI